jgi:glyoxylase-like metal-dependent hydrolase (beta-lactamase superfamily II)
MTQELIEQYASNLFTVAPGVWGRKEIFVNFYIIKDEASGAWALVDAGLKWSAPKIKSLAKDLFGEGSKPSAIILTHGHFDHIGALDTLIKDWDVPVYAHSLELPYLTGQSAYPPPDPSVGGGMMSTLSFLYPTGPIDIREHVRPLPNDNTIPGLPEWKYIHTPGHSPGHISLFRERDKVLIVGDAFVTTKAESTIFALTHMKHLSGPPKYFTCNWASAKLSILKLTALDPEIVATGHGKPMQGAGMRNQLDILSRHFDEVAMPAQGRYVREPAVTDESGVVFLPHSQETIPTSLKIMAASMILLSVGFLIYRQAKKQLA